MEKYAWMGRVVEGKLDEYKRRHDTIWPEMKKELKRAGICNYTVWQHNNMLFGYYECKNGTEFSSKVQRESEIVARWNEYMKDILIMDTDPETGAQPRLEKVFEMN